MKSPRQKKNQRDIIITERTDLAIFTDVKPKAATREGNAIINAIRDKNMSEKVILSQIIMTFILPPEGSSINEATKMDMILKAEYKKGSYPQLAVLVAYYGVISPHKTEVNQKMKGLFSSFTPEQLSTVQGLKELLTSVYFYKELKSTEAGVLGIFGPAPVESVIKLTASIKERADSINESRCLIDGDDINAFLTCQDKITRLCKFSSALPSIEQKSRQDSLEMRTYPDIIMKRYHNGKMKVQDILNEMRNEHHFFVDESNIYERIIMAHIFGHLLKQMVSKTFVSVTKDIMAGLKGFSFEETDLFRQVVVLTKEVKNDLQSPLMNLFREVDNLTVKTCLYIEAHKDHVTDQLKYLANTIIPLLKNILRFGGQLLHMYRAELGGDESILNCQLSNKAINGYLQLLYSIVDSM